MYPKPPPPAIIYTTFIKHFVNSFFCSGTKKEKNKAKEMAETQKRAKRGKKYGT